MIKNEIRDIFALHPKYNLLFRWLNVKNNVLAHGLDYNGGVTYIYF